MQFNNFLMDLLPQMMGQGGGGGGMRVPGGGDDTAQIFINGQPVGRGGMSIGRGDGRGRGGINLGGGISMTPSEPAAPIDNTNSTGHIFTGDMPPMVWIQREQRAGTVQTSDPTSPSAVNNNNGSPSARSPTATEIASALEMRQRGNRAMGEGRLASALEFYTTAINLNPTDELSFSNRALTHSKLNNHEAAAKDAKECVRLNPSFYKGHYRLANALMSLGQYEEAIEAFKDALNLAPSDSDRSEINLSISKCESRRATSRNASPPPSRSTRNVDNDGQSSAPISGAAPPSPLTAEGAGLTSLDHFFIRTNSAILETQPLSADSIAAIKVPTSGASTSVDKNSATNAANATSFTNNNNDQSHSNSRQDVSGLSAALEAALTKLQVDTKPKVKYDAPDKLLELNIKYERIHELVKEVVKDLRQGVQNDHMGTPNIVAQSLHFANRFDHASAVKKVIGLTDMESITEEVEAVTAAQEALRAASDQKDRKVYHDALVARDKCYEELAAKTERAALAIEAISLLAEDAKKTREAKNLPQIMAPPGTVFPTNVPPHNVNSLPNSPPEASNSQPLSNLEDMLSKDEVAALLLELQTAEKKIHQRLSSSVKRTDASALQLLNALEAERKDYEELKPLMEGCSKIKERIRREYVDLKVHQLAKPCITSPVQAAVQAAPPQPAQQVTSPDNVQLPAVLNPSSPHQNTAICYRVPQPVTEQQLEALASTVPRLKRIRSDVMSFEMAGRRGQELLELEAQLEHERLKQERHRIQLKADLEWLSVKEDEDLSKFGRVQDALAATQDRINKIVERQSAVHQELLHLINGDRPELQWSASAGGNKVLRWLKGSGLWLNRAFSDYQIISTLSSTFSSKVYRARTRHGDEVTLKEVPVEDDQKRKVFQNEINVLSSAANHPNIVKLEGVFFDGPFAYIVMPYYNAGSFKTFLTTLSQRQKTTPQPTAANTNQSPAATNAESSTAPTAAADAENDNSNTEADVVPTSRALVTTTNSDPSTATSIPWHVFQEVMRQIVGGIAYLHEKGVVHQDIKPSNILLSVDSGSHTITPAITDFGIAKDIGKLGERDFTMTSNNLSNTNGSDNDLQRSVSNAGTFDFMAPERQSGQQRHATAKSDIWSLGMTIYTIASFNTILAGGSNAGASVTPTIPFLRPDDNFIAVDSKMVGNSERLSDLLAVMLSKDPAKRPTATEILAHPYFTVSQVEDFVTNRSLVESNKKMEAFRHYIHALRQGFRSKVLVSVVRSQMVESVTNIFNTFKEDDLLSPLFVVFRGEDGVDEGALTSEMFSLYFQQLITKDRILVSADTAHDSDLDNASAQPAGAMRAAISISPNAEYLPSSDPRIPINRFNVLGRVLLKSLVENRNAPFRLSPVIFKYFLGIKVTLTDLEGFDRSLAQNLKRLLIFGEEELLAASLDFSDISTKFLTAWSQKNNSTPTDGRGNADSAVAELRFTRDTAVTAENVRHYIQIRVEYELTGKREEQLQAMKSGFFMSKMLEPHLTLFSVAELLMQITGHQHIPPQTIVNALQFVDFSSTSKTPTHLKEIILGFSQNNLRRFLMLCTPHVVIPASGLPAIKIQRTSDLQRLPVGHGCVAQLDLPDYNNKELLREKLAISLTHVNDGFFVA